MATSEPVVLRERLRAGATTIGAILPLDAPLLVELCGIAGFDFVFLDTEHGAILHPSYENLIRAADRWNLSTVVRVARDQPIEIGRALDAGAQGVHLPFVETGAQAEAAAVAARFFPLGQRGLGPVRAARYGFEPFDAYVKRANDETLVVAAIETPQAVEQIEAIGQVEGVDVIFIAPADLSVMLGHPGQFDHPEVTTVVEHAIADARATGKWVGSLAVSPEHARALAAAGVQYILMVFTGTLVRSLQGWLATARA